MTSRTRALAVMIALLLAGCLLGIAGHHLWEMRIQGRTALLTTPQAQRQTDRLAKRLQLSAEQAAQLKAILDESRRQINVGREEYDSKLRAVRMETNEKIMAILDEEQRKRFRQLLDEADAHRLPAGREKGRGIMSRNTDRGGESPPPACPTHSRC